MTLPVRYVRGPDGRLVAVPTPITPPEEVEPEEVEEEGSRDDVSDVLEVSEDDVMGTDADNPRQELDDDDMEDLFGVSNEDIMGYPPKPKKTKIRRTTKYYPTPPTTLGGMR